MPAALISMCVQKSMCMPQILAPDGLFKPEVCMISSLDGLSDYTLVNRVLKVCLTITDSAPSDFSLEYTCLFMTAAHLNYWSWPTFLIKILPSNFLLRSQHVANSCLFLACILLVILYLSALLLLNSACDLTPRFCSFDLSSSRHKFAGPISWYGALSLYLYWD